MPKQPKAKPPNNPLVVALTYDGLCTFEFGVAVEVFGLARPEMGAGWYHFSVAAVEAGPMKAIGGVDLTAKEGLDILQHAGTIIVPGWRGSHAPVPDTLATALRAAHANGARIMSICSGVFVLAAAGLLRGRRATTHWRYFDALRAQYPEITVVPDVLYVDEGDVLTSAGSAAGIDLCLHVVRHDYGIEAANSVARRLVVAAHRDGSQSQLLERAVPVSQESARIGPLLDKMRSRLGGDYSVSVLAASAGMSQRTFLRRFEAATGLTPSRWLLHERLKRARELLEETQLGVNEIADDSGFGSEAALRHHFREKYSMAPSAYRMKFARIAAQESG